MVLELLDLVKCTNDFTNCPTPKGKMEIDFHI